MAPLPQDPPGGLKRETAQLDVGADVDTTIPPFLKRSPRSQNSKPAGELSRQPNPSPRARDGLYASDAPKQEPDKNGQSEEALLPERGDASRDALGDLSDNGRKDPKGKTNAGDPAGRQQRDPTIRHHGIADIKARLNVRVLAFCKRYLQNGHVDGHHWRVGDKFGTAPKGEQGGSMVVDLEGQNVGKWKDFSTDEGGDLLDILAAQVGEKEYLREAKAFLGLNGSEPRPATAPAAKPDQSAEEKRAQYKDQAHRMFAEAREIPGTPAEAYLRQTRGIELEPWPTCLRFDPAARMKAAEAKDAEGKTIGPKKYAPALLCQVVDGIGNFLGIQRVFLDPANPDMKHPLTAHAKKSLGPVKGGAIHLTPPAKIIGVCEGPENGASLLMMALACGWLEQWPVGLWAVPGASSMAALGLPDECEELWIFADNDHPDRRGRRAGQINAKKLADAALAAGKGVKVIFPKTEGEDWNDLLRKHGANVAGLAVEQLIEAAHLMLPGQPPEFAGRPESGDDGAEATAEAPPGGDATGAHSYDEDGRPADDTSTRADDRQVLHCVGGELHTLVEKSQPSLAASGDIFQRGGQLVRVVRLEDLTPQRGIKRQLGALTIVPVDVDYLIAQLTKAIRWRKFDARSHKWRDIDAPRPVASSILATAGSWAFSNLRAIIEAPTLRPNGTVLERPGYDPATGIYFDDGGAVFEAIPTFPTRADALASLEMLADVLRGFPFVDADTPEVAPDRTSSFAVALAAILTALVRRSLRTAPMFGFTAPTMASGKSLNADVVAMIATGRPAAAMSYTNDPAEDRKRLFAALIAGDPVVCLDNVEEPLGSDALCSILTQESYRDRMLGMSQNITVPTCATFLATGNNLSIKGDLSTRTLMCHLDPGCERPEEREFDVDLYSDVPRRRPALVKAALTILRTYIVAGRPQLDIVPFGRFDEWSNLVRSALVWLGLKDPCASRSSVEDADPDRARLGNLLAACEATFGSRPIEVVEIIRTAKTGQGAEAEELRQALGEWMDRGEVNARRLGRFIAKMAGRVHGGLRFEKNSDKGKSAATWAVRQVAR